MEGGTINKYKIQIAKKIKDITKDEAIEDFEKLKNINCKDIKLGSLYGNKFLDYYIFPYRLDTETRKKINFYDFLKDNKIKKKESYKKNIEYSLKIDKKTLIQAKYAFFRLYYGSINQFKPFISKYIYCEYKPKTVLDFSAGWGGRLLGAMSLPNIKYIGFDTNIELKKPYEEIIEQLGVKDRAKIIFKDSAKIDYSKYDYDMVFTSPPYYTIEKYENMPIYKDKKDWYDKFLFPVIRNTFNNMQNNGHFILNIPIDIYDEVKNILGKEDEKISLHMQKRHKFDYKEFIYVWKKKGQKI